MAKPADAPIEMIARDAKNGRFLPGNSGNGGRRIGSRNLLSTQYCDDLLEAWQKHGKSALEATATLDPVAFVRVIGQLLPRDVSIEVDQRVEIAVSALEAYRLLKATPATELRQIEHDADC
jgi:hypothetical protein